MGNREFESVLLDQLHEYTDADAMATICTVLGFVGDRDAMRRLADIMNDDSALPVVRAHATLALGVIGDDNDIPVLSAFHSGSNYWAATWTLVRLHWIMNAWSRRSS
jgi:HEAT repeat protein